MIAKIGVLQKTQKEICPIGNVKDQHFITFCVHPSLNNPFFKPELSLELDRLLNKEHSICYDLYAYCIMLDHIHLIIKPINDFSLSHIFQKLKGSSAFILNKMLDRTGKFWQSESFDHLIRNAEILREK